MSGKQPSTPMPKDFEDLEFSVEQEEWNRYDLNDGATIKGRLLLTRIMRNPYNPQEMSFDFSLPVWVVYAPVALRGEPDTRPPLELQDDHRRAPKYEVHVNNSHEPWNVYRILKTGQKLKIKLTIQEVNRLTDKFDNHGMPSYNVPNGISVSLSKNQPDQGN
ncbi:MAG: hypothetical protein ACREAK_04045 [Nitrosarchaeum sp.]